MFLVEIGNYSVVVGIKLILTLPRQVQESKVSLYITLKYFEIIYSSVINGNTIHYEEQTIVVSCKSDDYDYPFSIEKEIGATI